ncbi:DNA alkylation repair protein [Patescibacteria group bacterium]|nr:DNA alkylation repair protein [Patescibacteria group bacterium]
MNSIQQALRKHASKNRKAANERFFKMGEGEYSAHDTFIGVSMPDLRMVAANFSDVTYELIKETLYSNIHEDRACALIILVNRYKEGSKQDRKAVVEFYLKHKNQINNWDLVDVSAPYIIGQYVLDNPKERPILDKLVVSKDMWQRRIAIVATLTLNRAGKIKEILNLSEKLFDDTEDLTHKAVGWMLREAWKQDAPAVERFIKKHYDRIPRTTLRYAIERMEESKRKKFLQWKIKKR